MTCPSNLDDPFRCPTKPEYLQALLALLPRGRAWQSHEEVATLGIERFPDTNAESGDGQFGSAQLGQTATGTGLSVMAQYWCAYAELLAFFSQRTCDLLDEFYCQSVNETLDLWGVDYGFPDACDPWDDLCAKVAARGGSTCDYIVWAASRRGWVVECSDCTEPFVEGTAVADCAVAECSVTCAPACDPNTVYITVRLDESEAYTPAGFNEAVAECAVAECAVLCEPDFSSVECLIERIKPAHVLAVYEFAT